MNILVNLIKNKKWVVLGISACLIIVVVMFIFSKYPSETTRPPVNTNEVPPVIVTGPELKIVGVSPAEGLREDVDRYSSTSFKFSAPVDITTVQITVMPVLNINKFVYESSPNTLVVEAGKSPWLSGVEYTITIKKGLKGLGGEELKEDLTYRFTNRPPEVIDFEGSVIPIDFGKL